MRYLLTVATVIVAGAAYPQSISSVYNRDTHDPFKLKDVMVESEVIGPVVRTSTWLTYENPYQTPTEATLNFDMPDAAALGGFAYLYGDEYVRGRLMDKNKAWFIYTAITSRGRDPGIMEQWSPTNYHCQIFPIKQGYDLRVKLWTVGMLQPDSGKLTLPKPSAPRAVSGYRIDDASKVKPSWSVRVVKSASVQSAGEQYTADLGAPVCAVAQRFKDGRIYVAGLVSTPKQSQNAHVIRILKARYEAAGQPEEGEDVTAQVAKLAASGMYSIPATNSTFGDPAAYHNKRLWITYQLDGVECRVETPENGTANLFSGADNGTAPTFFRLHQAKTVLMDGQTLAFSGWMRRNQKMAVRFNGTRYAFKPVGIPKGSDTARIWAQQMLAQNSWMHVRDVLAFSLKYGVPSNATALLAVPREEMKLYQQKEKQFQKQQAEQRRRELAAERQRREWSRRRTQNWGSSGGGDPEIRVMFPGAKCVEAYLPDGRVIELEPDGDAWGGNFEIPADAAEGTYQVRAVAQMPDGSTQEKTWTYEVKRTAPTGQIELLRENGRLILQVKSAPGLAEVAAYAADGTKWVLREVSPGVYRLEVPAVLTGKISVVLKDRAGNKGELTWSLAR